SASRRARTEDRGPDAHHRGALFDGDLEVGAHAHRELTESVTLAEFAQRAEPLARRLRLTGRRNRHEPAHAERTELGRVIEQPADRVGRDTALRLLAADV